MFIDLYMGTRACIVADHLCRRVSLSTALSNGGEDSLVREQFGAAGKGVVDRAVGDRVLSSTREAMSSTVIMIGVFRRPPKSHTKSPLALDTSTLIVKSLCRASNAVFMLPPRGPGFELPGCFLVESQQQEFPVLFYLEQ